MAKVLLIVACEMFVLSLGADPSVTSAPIATTSIATTSIATTSIATTSMATTSMTTTSISTSSIATTSKTIPELCNTELLGSLNDRTLALCTLVADWRVTPLSSRGQFVVSDFYAMHILDGSIVSGCNIPFIGEWNTDESSEDRSDVFVDRGALFGGELIDDFKPTNAAILWIDEDSNSLLLGMNLTGVSTETGLLWNSQTTITYYFIDNEKDLNGNSDGTLLVDHIIISSDSNPLISAFCPNICDNSDFTEWSFEHIGKSTQFRIYEPCHGKFIKFKMEHLTEYNGDDNKKTKYKETSFASSGWQWGDNSGQVEEGIYDAIYNKFVADTLTKTDASFELETRFFMDDEMNIKLKFNVNIRNWSYNKENNYLVLCIGIMTNEEESNVDNDQETNTFYLDGFEIDNIPIATCIHSDSSQADIDVIIDTDPNDNNNHLSLCYTFSPCIGDIEYDPVVSIVDETSETNEINEINEIDETNETNDSNMFNYNLYLSFLLLIFCII